MLFGECKKPEVLFAMSIRSKQRVSKRIRNWKEFVIMITKNGKSNWGKKRENNGNEKQGRKRKESKADKM